MTANADKYTDSGRVNNREQSDNWQSIGGLARKSLDNALAARAERAAREAVARHRAEMGDNSSFGYAYVYVPKEYAHIFRGAFPQRGGFCMLDWSGAGALLTHEEIAAEAFCNVLKAEGINAFWTSRVD